MNLDDPRFQQLARDATSRIQLWVRILPALDVRTMVEIGVWKGEFARQMLERCAGLQRYYMIDPWANLPDWNKPFNVSSELFSDVYEQAMRDTAFAAEKRIVLRGRTQEVIGNIEDGSVDCAYIDGDHTLRGITVDLTSVFGKVRDGGLIAGDDFTDRAWQHGKAYEPSLVCPFGVYFAEAMNVPVIALPFNQFAIHKTSQSSFRFIDMTGKYRDLSLRRLLSAAGRSRIRKTAERLLRRMRT